MQIYTLITFNIGKEVAVDMALILTNGQIWSGLTCLRFKVYICASQGSLLQ